MKASRSPRVQVVAEFLTEKHLLDNPKNEVTDENWQALVDQAMASDETFNFAWIKVSQYERNYIRRKVTNQVSKRLTSKK